VPGNFDGFLLIPYLKEKVAADRFLGFSEWAIDDGLAFSARRACLCRQADGPTWLFPAEPAFRTSRTIGSLPFARFPAIRGVEQLDATTVVSATGPLARWSLNWSKNACTCATLDAPIFRGRARCLFGHPVVARLVL
jgi:hypothetical protein